MAKSIEPQLGKIGEYLKISDEAAFVIPAYQRAYSWGTDRCDKLWSDVINYSESDTKDAYFFGTVILNCQKNDKELLLIDGQQRTTTFFLLLKAFLFKINDALAHMSRDEESQKLYSALSDRRKAIMSILYRLDPDDVDDEPEEVVFKNSKPLLINNSIREQFKEDFGTIIRATSFADAEENVAKIKFRQKDNKYSNFFRNFKFFYTKASELSDSQLNTIAKTFIKDCELIDIKSWNLEQAITMFNSLNSDSLPLNDADIISSKLYESAEHNKEEASFKDAWEEFHSLSQSLEEKNICNIDSLLMQYMYYERARRRETTSDSGALIITTPGLRRYFIDINSEAISQPLAFSDDVIGLAHAWNKASEYSSVQTLLRVNENARLFLASYFFRLKDNISEEIIAPIAECLIKLFTIMEIEETGYSSKYFKSFLFGEQIKIIDKNVSVEEIQDDFRKHINSSWNYENIKQKIAAYDRHMLVYINEYLFAKERQLPFSLKDKYDIEHIMPASGRDLQTIRTDAKIESEEEFKGIVNKLGNKILLEYAINRSIGNEWFRTKVSTVLENKTGYINSNFPVARYLVEKYRNNPEKYWTKYNIIEATEEASTRIAKFIFN